MWAYDPRKSDPLTRDPATNLATNRGDDVLNPAFTIQTWWDGQPTMVAGKANINYINPARRWVEGRQQLIIPYKDNFKKITGSSDAFYRNLHNNLGYEATLPVGLETQVWNDNTKGQGGDWSNVNAAVQKTLPGIGAIYWSGYTYGDRNWSLLQDSRPVVRASQIFASFAIRERWPTVSAKQAYARLMKTASHWADESKSAKIAPEDDTFGFDLDDMGN